jgi:hypothetical protein
MKDDLPNAGVVAVVPIADEVTYEVECSRGHRSFILLQQQRFEVLFQIGAYAIVDGYTREAASSFTASLERFYEFFIRAALIQNGVPSEATTDAWKAASRRSERQLGAFIFLHLRETGTPPLLMSDKDVAFRNDVVHRGKIPTRLDAIGYGERILALVRPLVKLAQTQFPAGTDRLAFDHWQSARKKVGPDFAVATISIGTILSLTRADEPLLEQRNTEASAVANQPNALKCALGPRRRHRRRGRRGPLVRAPGNPGAKITRQDQNRLSLRC